MHLLNLSLLQFVAALGGVSAIAVALYLLDRTRRRQVVSTLRFWSAAEQPAATARRRRIHQPWSLILQLLSMALLLLAIAQLRFGDKSLAARDHVLVLETSAWMGAKKGESALMDEAKARARDYIRAMPPQDRIMVVRADALATPATGFETDRSVLQSAIDASRPAFTALDLDQALDFARHMQSQAGRHAGEIAFIGTGHTSARDAAHAHALPSNLRLIPIADAIDNCGLRSVAARRSQNSGGGWEIAANVRNYGKTRKTVSLSLESSTGAKGAAKSLTLLPDSEAEVVLPYAEQGSVAVVLTPDDAFSADNRAQVEIPAQSTLLVVVYTRSPAAFRPLLSSNPRLTTVYRDPSQYTAGDSGLVVLDRFIPPEPPAADSLWIDPPPRGSPIPIRSRAEPAQIVRWDDRHPVGEGLRTRDLKLESASVFETAPGDARIAETASGPVIAARSGKTKMTVLGFHFDSRAARYALATPLLFANVQRWVSPGMFRQPENAGGSAGTVRLTLDDAIPAERIGVTGPDGSKLPFTLRGRSLSFFAPAPGAVRVTAGDREYVYSLTLPRLWDGNWQPPRSVQRGIPRFGALTARFTELWPWLALAGGLGLCIEWSLFGRLRRAARARFVSAAQARETVEARR
jgi:hypothetical protein